MRILLVDDDQSLVEGLKKSLAEYHYTVDVAGDGEAGWQDATTFDYDVILLDVMLPKLDGVVLCRRLRNWGCRSPILLLTARDSKTDKIEGLDAGADDYVVKPFDVEELAARIRALLRRESQSLPPVLQWGNLKLDPSACEVTYQGQQLHLTPKEYALLELFLRNSQRVFSHSALLDRLWPLEESPGEEAVRTHIKGLRQKLKAVGAPPDLIETIYGMGYRLKAPPLTPIPLPEPRQPARRLQTQAALAQAWEQCKDKSFTQLVVLEEVVTASKGGLLKEGLRQQAERAAHSLSGTLGTFGFSEASRRAREIERLLQQSPLLETAQAEELAALAAALRREMEGNPAGWPSESVPNPSPSLLLVSADRLFAQQLEEEARVKKIGLAIAPEIKQAQDWLARELPDAVLFQFSPAESPSVEGMALMEALKQQRPELPILVIAEGGTLRLRLEVLRRGGRIFLEQPIKPSQVLEAALDVLPEERTEVKVLVVDDDPQLLASLPVLLEPWGVKLAVLDDPQQFWTVLQAVTPDLLVLDIEMPQISGLELCQVLRHDPHWRYLPVLFLTAHSDAQTQEQAFMSGADDFVSKPVDGSELARRILNRLERVRERKT
jgi:DNA-binding response OmpR family regulator